MLVNFPFLVTCAINIEIQPTRNYQHASIKNDSKWLDWLEITLGPATILPRFVMKGYDYN
jgi:hypothetical protein